MSLVGRGCENRTHSPWVKAAYLLQSIYPQQKNGSPTWARTTDQQINSLLLYRLSYWGTKTGADYRIRTDDLSLTRRLHYHCAKSALNYLYGQGGKNRTCTTRFQTSATATIIHPEKTGTL
jgi:hypothetical protein